MGTIYIIRKAGVPVALADAAGRADALRLFVESLDVSASVASTRDVLAHRALPLLQHVEPRVSPAPKKAAEGETDTLTGDMFDDAPAKRVKCDGNHGGPRCSDPECWNDDPAPAAPEVAAERPGEPQPVLATSAPAPEGRAHSSPTAEATADAHASTGGAQSHDAASAAAEPPASTAADELAAARMARLSDAYHAGRDAGRRGDGRFASVVEITDRLCEGMSDDQYDEVREEARRGFDAGAASRAQVLKARNTRVPVKYRDPQTGSTWSGRGLKPRWLAEALAAGRSLEAFAVDAKA